MTIPSNEPPQENGDSPLYYISFERLDELRRSAIVLLASRRGPSCPSRLQPDHELTDPQQLVDEIADYCSADQGFIRPDMPIQEIVFRILLSRRNQPTPLQDLHYELTEKWATPIRPISITKKGMRRVLDHDTYYGFARANPGD